jgi:hypothetical protein
MDSSVSEGVKFGKAYFIKLGKGGAWEADCIANGRLRIGWDKVETSDLNSARWDDIERTLRQDASNAGTATNELNRLRDFAQSTSDDVWITFFGAALHWARMADAPIEEDSTSKFRRVTSWSKHSVTGKLLATSELPVKLSQTQGFRSTICRVLEPVLLRRVLSDERSPLAEELSRHREALVATVIMAVEELHWKDYESLVDMVFRHAGWRRMGILGQQTKSYDLELREPVTDEKYLVQVKSKASLADLVESTKDIDPEDYRRVFYVVHSPSKDLAEAPDLPSHIEVIPPRRLAELTVDAGLVNWLEDKVA